MKYAILVYETEQDFANREMQMPAYNAYSQALADAGVMAGGAALHPSNTGTTIRIQNGQRNVQDGPYADTKEQLGGFFIIDVPASNCAVEVRPLLPTNQK
jgi:hypothetical protein